MTTTNRGDMGVRWRVSFLGALVMDGYAENARRAQNAARWACATHAIEMIQYDPWPRPESEPRPGSEPRPESEE